MKKFLLQNLTKSYKILFLSASIVNWIYLRILIDNFFQIYYNQSDVYAFSCICECKIYAYLHALTRNMFHCTCILWQKINQILFAEYWYTFIFANIGHISLCLCCVIVTRYWNLFTVYDCVFIHIYMNLRYIVIYTHLYAFANSRYMSVKLPRTDIRHTFLYVLSYAQNLSAIARF